MNIVLGPAGSPVPSTREGIAAVNSLGLGAMEVAFTHGVRMRNETADELREINEQHHIALSIHAPYYINLLSDDRKIVSASKQRILDTCERAHHMGASPVVFHVGYYGTHAPTIAQQRAEEAVGELVATIERNAWNVTLAPETSGKQSQYGSLDEIVRLSAATGCTFCVDIAHLFARNGGTVDYTTIFDMVGKRPLHVHFSGIAFGPKGERHHLVLGEGGPDFRSFAHALLARRVSATIISESPVTWKDSLTMKQIIEELGYRF